MSTQASWNDDFDWVSARAQCTPFKVFEKLRSQVKEDVSKRRSIPFDETGIVTFSFESGSDWFLAARKTLDRYISVTFSLGTNGVTVQDNSRQGKHEGIVTISNEGRCAIRVDSTELTLWQFRKLALHDLFFVVERKDP